MDQKYKASLDKWALGITLGISALFASIALILLLTSDGNTGKPGLGIAVVGILSAILLFCYLFRPLAYYITLHNLVIKRPFSDIKIELKEIEQVRKVTTSEVVWSIRTFGNGGLFGFYGKFWNKQLGHMSWYATKRGNFVLVKTKEDNIILTPDNAVGFVDAFIKAGKPKNTPVSA